MRVSVGTDEALDGESTQPTLTPSMSGLGFFGVGGGGGSTQPVHRIEDSGSDKMMLDNSNLLGSMKLPAMIWQETTLLADHKWSEKH